MARLHQNLTKIAALAPHAAAAALLQTGADIVDLTQQLTPVDTGKLQGSYKAQPQSETVIHIGSEVNYAPFVEYGTVNSPSQPHLIPAFVRAQNIFHARLGEEVRKLPGVG